MIHPEAEREQYRDPTGVGIDWITITVPVRDAGQLLDETRHLEDGYGGKGFARSERRECIGGDCWRNSEPYTASKLFGKDYESWEFPGASACMVARQQLGKAVKPTRIDVAFDYQVDKEYFPSSLESHFVPWCDSKGVSIAYAGDRKTHTVYVGSRQSDRMLRIYRRDLKDGNYFEPGVHLLRVELVLRGDALDAYWKHCVEKGEHDYGVAASHVEALIGLRPIAEVGELPPLAPPDVEQEAVQMVFQFVRQHHSMLQACEASGVDLGALAAVSFEKPTRVQRMRLSQRLDALSMLTPSQLARAVSSLLRDGAFS